MSNRWSWLRSKRTVQVTGAAMAVSIAALGAVLLGRPPGSPEHAELDGRPTSSAPSPPVATTAPLSAPEPPTSITTAPNSVAPSPTTRRPVTPGTSTAGPAVTIPEPPRDPIPPTNPATKHLAVGGNRSGSPTFADTKGVTPGPRPVGFGEQVEVSCKILDKSMPSASPEGYWYRLASDPWHNQFYAVANTFTNGDRLGDPNGTTFVDRAIPDCTA